VGKQEPTLFAASQGTRTLSKVVSMTNGQRQRYSAEVPTVHGEEEVQICQETPFDWKNTLHLCWEGYLLGSNRIDQFSTKTGRGVFRPRLAEE